jgi:hypothetical protein
MKHATVTETTFMDEANLSLITKPRGRSVQRVLVSFSAAYFAGALVTDLVYWRIPDVLWERFSIWLIVAGLVMAGVAAIAYVIDLAGGRDRPACALADQRLHPQPRRLHCRRADGLDAFRARHLGSLADGLGWQRLGK